MAFGPSKYMPGQIKSQPMAELYRNQNPDEEYMRMMQMMDSQAPRALQPMQTETAKAQLQSSPIQAPKDRGMFGRFQGFNPLRFDPDKGVGEGNRLYAIGAMLSGMGSGDPALTANLLEPKLQANRARVQKRSEEQKTAEEEARRRAMAQQLGVNPELFAMDPAIGLQFMQQQQAAAERADDRTYNRGRDQVGDERFERQWLTEQQRFESEQERADRLEARDIMESDRSFGLQEREFGLRQTEAQANDGMGSFGLTPVYGRDKDGNRVILQTNKAGGVIQSAIPEGVTLEDDYSRAFDRTSGTEAAKKAAYETTAGRALSAFENKADLLVSQIDTAIDQTNKLNTGVVGQLIAAGDLDGTLDAIGAKAMLSELIAIKEQGGTMGALSDSEGAALRNAAVNVARSQSEKQLDANLRTYRLQVEKTKMTMKKAFEDEYVNGPNAVRGAAPAAPANTRVGPSGQPVPEGFE